MAHILTPRLLTTRLGVRAREIANRFAMPARRLAESRAGAATADRDWLQVPLRAEPPSAAAMAVLTARHLAEARAGRWVPLLAALADADAARAIAPDGSRLSAAISAAARADVTAALAAGDLAAATLAAGRLEEAHHACPGSAAAAHLLARARLDLAAAHREATLSGPASAGHLAAARAEAAEAARLVDVYDPIEHDSPLMAATRYALVGALEEAEALWQDWYEDWIDLDPGDPAPHLVHASHLLPNWFGTLSGFDAAARAAAARTADVTGAAAYALHYLSAQEALGRMPPGLDTGMYLKGLDDHCRDAPGQEAANRVAATLTEWLHDLGPDDGPFARRIRAALTRHLQTRLTEFHLPAWAAGERCIRWALQQCFGDGIDAGGVVAAGPGGLIVIPA